MIHVFSFGLNRARAHFAENERDRGISPEVVIYCDLRIARGGAISFCLNAHMRDLIKP